MSARAVIRFTIAHAAALFALAMTSCGPRSADDSRGQPTTRTASEESARSTRTWQAIDFDPAQLEFPEGITFDAEGRLFVGLTRWAEVREIEPDGTMRSFAKLLPPDKVPIAPGTSGLLGLASTPTGDLYAALITFDPTTHGVYRIDGATRRSERLPGSEAICWPNALVFDARGILYVTESTRVSCGGDSTVGAVWRIPPGGRAERWIESTALAGTGQLPIPTPVGANGIVFQPGRGTSGTLIVANTEKGSLLSIPILPDGRPGSLTILAQDPRIFTVDGIVLDRRGAIYAMVIGQNRIVRVSPDGRAFNVVASGAPLDFPVNAAFGSEGPDRERLFVVNFALPNFGGTKPGVVVLEP